MSQRQRQQKKLLDSHILDKLQQDIPFIARPWEKIAQSLGVSELFLLKRIDFLKKKGIIRRISATFDPKKIGFVSTLVAVKVKEENIYRAVKKINRYTEVTHNYQRNSEYNIWFTLVAENKERVEHILEVLKKNKNIDKIIELPAKRLFKINVNFKVSE